MGLYLYRLMGAATLDASMYEGVEADHRTNLQATVTVLLASVAAGLGAGGRFGLHPGTMVALSVLALITWVAWALLIFHVGTRVLPGPETRVTLGELLRTTGFAAAPGLLQVFALLPGLSGPVFIVTWLWMLATMVVAVEHALDYDSPWRAIAVCVVALTMSAALAAILGILGGPALS